MADMFLKISNVKGEAKDATHQDEIDILAWTWGASQSGSSHMGGGGGSGKVQFQDVSVTKMLDASSTVLWESCAAGKHFDKATLTVRKAGGNPLEYYILNMEHVLITNVSVGAAGGEDGITENVTLNFSKCEYEYVEQKPDGSGAAARAFGWNIEENKKI